MGTPIVGLKIHVDVDQWPNLFVFSMAVYFIMSHANYFKRVANLTIAPWTMASMDPF